MAMSDEALIRKTNLRRALEARGMSVGDLARLAEKRVSYYSDLLNPNMAKHFGEKSARAIEELLHMRRGELDEVPATEGRSTSTRRDPATASVERVASLAIAPVIGWDNVRRMVSGTSPADLAETFLRSPVMTGPNTFAVRVRGDSMTAPHGKSYPDGCAIFVDPDKRAPSSGTRVLALLPSGEPTFKVYRDEDGVRWLQPLNPHFPVVQEPFEIVGTVIGKWEDE